MYNNCIWVEPPNFMSSLWYFSLCQRDGESEEETDQLYFKWVFDVQQKSKWQISSKTETL